MKLDKTNINYKKIIEYVYYAILLIAVIWAGRHYQNLSDIISVKYSITTEEMKKLDYARMVLESLCALVLFSLLIRYFKIRNKKAKTSHN